MSKKKTHKKLWMIPISIVGIIVLALGILLILFSVRTKDAEGLSPAGTTLGELDLGEKTESEVRELLDNFARDYLSRSVRFELAGTPARTVDFETAGVSLDTEVLFNRIFANKQELNSCEDPRQEFNSCLQSDSFFKRFKQWLGSSLSNSISLDGALVFDTEKPLRLFPNQEPIDAEFKVTEFPGSREPALIEVVPSEPGFTVEWERGLAEFERSLDVDVGSRGPVIIELEGSVTEADLTTAEAEALEIKHLITQFTTFHACCQPRVENIHLVADILDGTVLKPGESVNLNQLFGERTEERGFQPDGTIIGGVIVDTVGGGISQFATTFYNTVFWAGFEHIIHRPHGFYFGRYPEGIEATISWPYPDLIATNSFDSGVLFKTEYSDRHISIKIYGDNDGRTTYGRQSHNRSTSETLHQGGDDAVVVSAWVSERYDYKNPPETPKYVTDEELACGEEKVSQEFQVGWSVDVHRTITQGDQKPIIQKDTVVYNPMRKVIKRGPC